MRSLLLVATGGALGAAMRWAVTEAITTDGSGFPWATFAVNLVGCTLIGFAARFIRRGSDAWFAIVTGVLGGLTTFSAFADETRVLLDNGRTLTATVYIVASVLGGVLAVELARGRVEAP